MSKTTKIIAALGVVAGLGVAALPAFTFAETVTGDVDVVVEVQPAIAMTITGNNDNGSHYKGTLKYTAVADPSGQNPKGQGWYERANDTEPYTYELTEDTAPQGGKTYYIGSTSYGSIDTFAPSSIAGGTLDGHPIPGTPALGPSSVYTSIAPNTSVHGDDGTSTGTTETDNGFYSLISVYTNSATGFNLGISGEGANDALGALTQQDAVSPETIPANGIVKAGASGWGYSKTIQTDAQGSTPNYQTAANSQLTTMDTKTSSGSHTTVFYGVSTTPDVATGVYKATVTYTATTK